MNQMVLAASEWLNFNSIVSGYMAMINSFSNLRSAIVYNSAVRRTVRELSALSDYELNDMGISRGMIYEIAKGAARD